MSDPRSAASSEADEITTVPAPDPGAAGTDGRLVLTLANRVFGEQDSARDAPPTDLASADTALLRKAVREILEEELRGDFGTRVTRGVRKLVRAEVRMLMSAREADQG